jgi:hypothetical protein
MWNGRSAAASSAVVPVNGALVKMQERRRIVVEDIAFLFRRQKWRGQLPSTGTSNK